jgi:hypothetical protein
MLVQIKVGHQSPMRGAHWCHPVGWTPANQLPGCEFIDGAWRNEMGDTAAIACFTLEEEGAIIEVPLEDLRVASCGEWQILQEVASAT